MRDEDVQREINNMTTGWRKRQIIKYDDDDIQDYMRLWVGLTDDDKVLIKHDANFNQFMTAGEYADRVQQLTEARLKDKNT